MRRRIVLPLVGLATALLLVATPAAAQRHVARFEITAVDDTTFSFRVGAMTWVKGGMTGRAVDPRKRDDLVARFRVLAVREGEATALVTGQTTVVSTEHTATLEEPPRAWFRAKTFWAGLLLGGLLGAVSVGASR